MLGPAGTGKSLLTLNFAVQAIARGETAAMFIFDEELGLLFERAKGLGMDLAALQGSGKLIIEQVDAAELAPGEFAQRVRTCVEQHSARTVIVDSLNGYQAAMPEEKQLILHMHELLQFLNRQVLIGQDQKTFDEVIHFAQISRPGIFLARLQQSWRQRERRTSITFGHARHEVLQEDWNFLLAFAQRRQLQSERIQAVVEIFAKTLSGKSLRYIDIGAPLTNFQGVLRGVPEMVGVDEALMEVEKV